MLWRGLVKFFVYFGGNHMYHIFDDRHSPVFQGLVRARTHLLKPSLLLLHSILLSLVKLPLVFLMYFSCELRLQLLVSIYLVLELTFQLLFELIICRFCRQLCL